MGSSSDSTSNQKPSNNNTPTRIESTSAKIKRKLSIRKMKNSSSAAIEPPKLDQVLSSPELEPQTQQERIPQTLAKTNNTNNKPLASTPQSKKTEAKKSDLGKSQPISNGNSKLKSTPANTKNKISSGENNIGYSKDGGTRVKVDRPNNDHNSKLTPNALVRSSASSTITATATATATGADADAERDSITTKVSSAAPSMSTTNGARGSDANKDFKASEETTLEYTKVEDIEPGIARVHAGFRSGKTQSIQFRLNQLRNLYFAIKENQPAICHALSQDFHRVPSETINYEIATGLGELLYIMSQLHKWVKPEKVTDLPLNLSTSPVYIERIPLGVVLVIAAFNYPLFVSISPIVGAIAAGNTVVLKQSEATPHFSQLFTNILSKALDPEIFFPVNGAVPETTELLKQKVDKIIFTGSATVGKIIASKAAETLTPTILELGGKTPAFVLDDVKDKDLPTVARRIAWGRFANSGQTCIAVDYVFVAKSKHGKFVDALKKIVHEEFYSNINANDKNYTHLINQRAFNRIENIIKTTKGDIITGGDVNPKSLYVAPTVIDNATWSDSSMQAEIFGPILPILTYDDVETASNEVIANHDTPLALYIFTSGATSPRVNPQIKTIATKVRSGGMVINDVLMHIALHNAPFGGVGQSGYGAYHGKFSFLAFSHERTTIEQQLWNDWVIKARYPPHTNKKDKLVKTSQLSYGGRVWFARDGNVRKEGPTSFFNAWTGALGLAELVKDFIGASI